ncbi:MAG: hypothetical protein R6W66_07395 [Pelovirga sp.]
MKAEHNDPQPLNLFTPEASHGRARTATSITLESGIAAFDKTAQVVAAAPAKTTPPARKTFDKAARYRRRHPDKAIFIALGIGVGLGLLAGASTHRSRSRRLAEPLVNAAADVALAFFR